MKYITAYLFILIVLISIPLEIISSNIEEFGELRSSVIIFFSGSIIFIGFILILSRIVKLKTFNVISKFLFIASIYFLITDIITPLTILELETGNETPSEPVQQIILQGIILAILVISFFRLKHEILPKLALPIFIGILIYESYLGIITYKKFNHPIQDYSKYSHTTDFEGNIYHFIFDAYKGGSWITKCINDLNLEDEFRGFINYENARSNYLYTHVSLHSFMSGSLYLGEETFREWKNKAYELSIINKLKENGFRTTAYSIRISTGNHFANSNNIISSISPLFIVDLWLLRIIPAFLRNEVFYNGKGIISRYWGEIYNVPSGDFRSYTSYVQYKKMLKDEVGRNKSGEYVYAHFNQPHIPNQLNRHGIFVGKSNYLESSYLATNMMVDFIRMLKEAGKFNSSLIIFQSDHGTPSKLNSYKEISNLDDIRIQAVDVHGWPGHKVDHRTRVLLLIKPPKTNDNEIRHNQNLVQLLDIPKLIYHIIQTPNLNNGQINRLLKKDTVHIYHIWKQNKGVLGKDIRSGQFNHYSVDNDNKWEIHDNIDFTY